MHDTATTNGHLNGELKGGSGIVTVTADGTLDINCAVISFDTTGGAIAVTLPDGAQGQKLEVRLDVDGGDAVMTFNGASTATYTTPNQSLFLAFNAGDWVIDDNVGTVTIA